MLLLQSEGGHSLNPKPQFRGVSLVALEDHFMPELSTTGSNPEGAGSMSPVPCAHHIEGSCNLDGDISLGRGTGVAHTQGLEESGGAKEEGRRLNPVEGAG